MSSERSSLDEEYEALMRLIEIAKADTGQSRWWNPASCGSFDLTNLWAVDLAIADDMQIMFGMIAHLRARPDALDLGKDFEQIIAQWRPELLEKEEPKQ